MINHDNIQDYLDDIKAIEDDDYLYITKAFHSPKKELCYHFHRVKISFEDGCEKKLPKEEFRVDEFFYEFPSRHKIDLYYAAKEPLLKQISDTKCICAKCTREFPLENIDKMFLLFDRINELGEFGANSNTYFSDMKILNLYQELEPTWYQKDYQNNIVVLGTENDAYKWRTSSYCYTQNLVSGFIHKYPVLQLPEIYGNKLNVCKHYYGHPSGIVAHILSTKDSEMYVPLIGGGVESLVFTNPYGVCKCQKCKRIFTPQEKEQMSKLVSYLNTPHYYTKEDLSHHEEMKPVLDFYDKGYKSENEPYALLNNKKILELTYGIEPILCKGYKRNTKIISTLKWKNGKWTI